MIFFKLKRFNFEGKLIKINPKCFWYFSIFLEKRRVKLMAMGCFQRQQEVEYSEMHGFLA